MQNYLATVASQYLQSPTMGLWLEAFNDWLDPSPIIDEFFASEWDLDTATGYGLDVLGRIIGANRNLTVSGVGVVTLSDPIYRVMLNAKALANISDGSILSLNNILMTLFPSGGNSYVVDNQDMTMAITLGFTPNKAQSAILSTVFPVPAGVVITVPGGGGGSLAVTIGSGTAASGNFASDTFAPNTAHATGGSGSYAYAWTETDDAAGTWTIANADSTTATLSVAGVANGATSSATLKCTVTDTATGATAFATTSYSLDNTTVAGTFAVSIGAGSYQAGAGSGFTWPPNTVSVIGGSGSFTYLWRETDDGGATWTIAGSTTPTATLIVSHCYLYSAASLTCTVTDTVSGTSVTSAPSDYSYFRNTGVNL